MVDGDNEQTGRSRREILKLTGAAGATTALGSLAGCSGSGDSDSDGGGGGSGSGNGSGGGSETVTVAFLSAAAAENSAATTAFQKSMKAFEEQEGGVKVDLQKTSYGDIKNKLSSTVAAGNAPALAEAGSAGLSFFLDGNVPDHGKWIEGTDGYPDDWTSTNKQVANFRDTWWCGGAASGSARGVALRPKLVSQVGVTDPTTEMNTWSGMYDVVRRIDEQLDTIAWEETGAYNDLESYWGEARTTFKNGDDPWIRGNPKDPKVLMGKDPKTNGMVKNCVKLANEFSSDKVASRTDEEMASLLLTDRVAIEPHGFQSWAPFTSVKSDATFGWNDGNGDVMWIPYPKMDPEYGSTIGISELEGVEGQHGGHVSALEASKVVFKGDQKKMDLAWKLNVYTQTNENHMFPLFGKADPGIPQWQPMLEKFQQELELPQLYLGPLQALKEYGPQYTATGAGWDVKGTDKIRWTDMNETISTALAGQHGINKLPGIIREKILGTLSSKN